MNGEDKKVVDRLLSVEATSVHDLVEMYCFRCRTGMYNCKISARKCDRIRFDRDFSDNLEEWGDE